MERNKSFLKFCTHHFRNRIRSECVELILKESIPINGKDGREDTGSIGTTTLEKNVNTRPIVNYTSKSLKNVTT